ncbi:MAG: hypothetical protein HC893_16605 [Chloroflexaceae bacterium]|nr:hypothetical protein [Chloroflexaceae bacterium]
MTVDGVEYNFQVFGVDTLYNRIPDWSDVQQLSRLARTTSPERVRLREALLAELYRRAGGRYEPGWSFHQLARAWNIGAPLSDAYGADIEGTPYNVQTYTLDTLFNIVPHWAEVRRLTELVGAQYASGVLGRTAAVLGGKAPEPSLPVGKDASWEPPAPPTFHLLQYTSMSPIAAFSPRADMRIRLVVLHGDRGPARTTLERMASVSANASTHYYVTK